MDTVNLIYDYFPELTEEQRERFARLEGLYREWNEKINVISRKDMDEFWVHHVLHSLAIAKIIRFAPGTRVMDVGTGGGFPGIPLAILFPEVNFYLIDSIGKKIKVVEGIRDALGLQHVRTEQIRVENVAEQQDFIVSRAVTAFPAFVKLIRGKIRKEVDESCDPLRYGFGRNNEDLLIFHEALCLFCGKNDILVVWKDVDHVRIYLLDGI